MEKSLTNFILGFLCTSIRHICYSPKALIASKVYHVITTANGRVERTAVLLEEERVTVTKKNLKIPRMGLPNSGPGIVKSTSG
jgi:hypothetical protein